MHSVKNFDIEFAPCACVCIWNSLTIICLEQGNLVCTNFRLPSVNVTKITNYLMFIIYIIIAIAQNSVVNFCCCCCCYSEDRVAKKSKTDLSNKDYFSVVNCKLMQKK